MFTEEQIKKLNSKLSQDQVKTRKQGGANLSYIEGYAAIEAANEIFGFGKWSGKVLELTQVESSTFKKDGRDGFRVAYIARYEVNVRGKSDSNLDEYTGCVAFDDVGFGSGTSYLSLGDAIESATKEAVTDAMKRAMRNFGNRFGLALYDKEQRNVDRGEFDPTAAREKILNLPQSTKEDVRTAYQLTDRDALIALYKEIAARKAETAVA